MNNKGFTLIELVVTIALLAVVSIISFVSITTIINKSNENECNNLEKTIISATKSYISDNRYSEGIELNMTISASTLKNDGYLTEEIVNPYTKEKMEFESILISIELNNNYTPKVIEVVDWQDKCKS